MSYFNLDKVFRKQQIEIPVIPTGKHTLNCVDCGDEFTTNYPHQKYCLVRCTRGYKKKPKKENADSLSSKEQSKNHEQKRKKGLDKERQNTLLNRQYLTMDMSGKS